MSGQQILRIVVDETNVPCTLVDADLERDLWAAGYAPQDFNHIRWPIGASNHATGRLLVTSTAMAAIVSAGFPSVETVSIQLGDSGSPITLAGMQLLPPEPIFVAGTGVKLFAIPVVCRRYQRLTRTADANYNLVDHSDRAYQPDTLGGTGGLGNGIYSYDEVITALATDASLPLTITDAETYHAPADVRAYGTSAAKWIDAILAESGRVYVLSISGTGTVELIDKRNVFGVLTSLKQHVMHGGANFALSGVATGWQTGATPVAAWMSQDVPAAVRIVNPAIRPSSNYWANDPWTAVTQATYNASTASLTSGNQALRDVADYWPVYDASEMTAVELERVEWAALQFYRRFKAGAMAVELKGIRSPTLGGSCQAVEWICDGARGFRTRLYAATDWKGYGGATIDRTVVGGDLIQIRRRGDGSIDIKSTGEGRNPRGTITGVNSTGSSGTLGTSSQLTYTAESLDGRYSTDGFVAPLYRPYNDAVILIAATLASPCELRIEDDGTVNIAWCQERILFDTCDDAAAFRFGDGTPDNSDRFLVDIDGEVLADIDGNVLVEYDPGVTDHPENAILTDIDGNIIFDIDGNAAVDYSACLDGLVSPAHYDGILSSIDFEVLTDFGGGGASVAYAPPADGKEEEEPEA